MLALLHDYIGARLIPAMALGAGDIWLCIALLIAPTVLVPTGLFAPARKRFR